jgi:biotin carboxyl carrier protein
MPTFKLQIGDEIKEFEAIRQGDKIRLKEGEHTYELTILNQDGRSLQLALRHANGSEKLIRLAGHNNSDDRQLWVNGRTFTAKRIRRRATGADSQSGSLAAAIPAVVSEILVNIGDTVTTGDKLILLESMKMVIPIQAPYSGTVTAINCQPGESVAAGIPLLEIDKSNTEQG